MKLLLYISALIILQLSYIFSEERNIILFVTDDQSPDAGCYGNEKIKMPNLDKLASDGTLFKHAFATTASCSASRSVILTGLHNHLNGQFGHQHNTISSHLSTTFSHSRSFSIDTVTAPLALENFM